MILRVGQVATQLIRWAVVEMLSNRLQWVDILDHLNGNATFVGGSVSFQVVLRVWQLTLQLIKRVIMAKPSNRLQR